MRRKRIQLALLLFSVCSFSVFAQDNSGGSGDSGSSGTTRIWEPDLVELWIYWHKVQYRMFTEFALNQDSLQRNQYSEYEDWMKKLSEVDKILFSQYQNNSVPLPLFVLQYGEVINLTVEIAQDCSSIDNFLNEPPVSSELNAMFTESFIVLLLKYQKLLSSTTKVTSGNQPDNLRDNRIRDDLMNNIIKEMTSIKYSLSSLYKRMNTAKQALRYE